MERITSRQNAIVKRFRDLARTSRASPRVDHAAHAGHAADVLLDGEHLVQEALRCDIPIEIAAFSDKQLENVLSPIARIAKDVKKRGGRVMSVTDQVLAAMSPVQHPSGVVAIARARPADVRVVMSAAADRPLVLVLAGLQDPGNVGAIVRAAAAFGASGVVSIEGSANPFSWKALRGAMGGTFRIPIAARGTLPDVIAAAQEHNVRLVAAVPRGGTALPKLDLREPTAIVLGGEGAGLPASTMSAVHETVTIPMRKPVESLNVAIAAAVVLYEATRQRQT
ncbi:MAG TPA: RNA methyltransferase [Vicinamibacterales bacterium]|nr:RNA methyltransferase [Vicinamibacterales bacterium]